MTRHLPAQARPFTAGTAAPLMGGRAGDGARSGRRCGSTCWLMMVTPLRLFTSVDKATVGGCSAIRCTWSSSPWNSTQGGAEVGAHVGGHRLHRGEVGVGERPPSVLRHQDHVDVQDELPDRPWRTRPWIVGGWCHDAGVSPVRYRYRAYPTGGQAQALARTFGCARVVYNDCLRLRQDAHERGEKLSDTEAQRRVVTLAKQTLGREWLGEVASVALVQACRDARRAYRNWFDSLSGKRKGRRVGCAAVPVEAGPPAVDPADPQRVHRPRQRAGVRGEGRGPAGGVVPSAAIGAVVVHGDPRGGRPVLRVVRRRPRPRPAAARRVGGGG